jgi:hypothetical protein
MGNVLAGPPPNASLADVPNVVLKDTLGEQPRTSICLEWNNRVRQAFRADRPECMGTARKQANAQRGGILSAASTEGMGSCATACAAGGGRFLRTLLCVHDEVGPVVVKASTVDDHACIWAWC